MTLQIEFVPHDALIVVDMQNDFFKNGPLAVEGAERIVPVVNRYLAQFNGDTMQVFATRCWHPENHCSFKPHGGMWPVHCMANSPGAQFYPELKLPISCPVFSKGFLADRDAYSGFQGTDLASVLRERGAKRLFIAGLATDYCVKATTLDALERGWPVFVLQDAIAAVNLKPHDGEAALDVMRHAGAVLMSIEALVVAA